MPIVAIVSPSEATARTPMRRMSCWAMPAPMAMPAVTGRKARPAFSGL